MSFSLKNKLPIFFINFFNKFGLLPICHYSIYNITYHIVYGKAKMWTLFILKNNIVPIWSFTKRKLIKEINIYWNHTKITVRNTSVYSKHIHLFETLGSPFGASIGSKPYSLVHFRCLQIFTTQKSKKYNIILAC